MNKKSKCCSKRYYEHINSNQINCISCGNVIDDCDSDKYSLKFYKSKPSKKSKPTKNLDWYDGYYDGYGSWDSAMYKKDRYNNE